MSSVAVEGSFGSDPTGDMLHLIRGLRANGPSPCEAQGRRKAGVQVPFFRERKSSEGELTTRNKNAADSLGAAATIQDALYYD